MKYVMQNYNIIEILFGQYKWCRKFFGGFWVKLREPGYSWIKYDKNRFNSTGRHFRATFEVEDYTDSDLDKFMKNLIYNMHGSISMDEIDANYLELLREDPYSSVYSCLAGQFKVKYICKD